MTSYPYFYTAYMQVYLFSSVFQKVNRFLYNYEGVSTYFCSVILKFLLLINKFCVKSIFFIRESVDKASYHRETKYIL